MILSDTCTTYVWSLSFIYLKNIYIYVKSGSAHAGWRRGGEGGAVSFYYSCPSKLEKNKKSSHFIFPIYLNSVYQSTPSNSPSFSIQKTTHRNFLPIGLYSIYSWPRCMRLVNSVAYETLLQKFHINTVKKLLFLFLSNWKGCDHGDSFPFDFEPNGIPFGSLVENCHHDHIPFNVIGNRNIVFSMWSIL